MSETAIGFRRTAVSWGLVGGLTFLVGVQGWDLLGGTPPVGLLGRLGLAVVVTVATAGVTAAVGRRITRKERS